MDPGAFCREIETYLCRRNHGHLIRIVGPAFERVCGWAQAGVPLQVVFRGIDRKLERYQATGRPRRPLRIEHCEADILEAFEEWRRAVGLSVTGAGMAASPGVGPPHAGADTGRRRASLPAHLDRVLAQATSLLALSEPAPGLHAALERLVSEVDALRGTAHGARGEARQALVDRLCDTDRALMAAARSAAGPALDDIQRVADLELAPFKLRMAETAFAQARFACADRLLRERYRLPAVRFDGAGS